MAVLATNLVPDPSMEVLVLEEVWDNTANCTLTPGSAEQAFVGTKSAKVVTTATNSGLVTTAGNRITVAGNTAYVISAYIYGAGVWNIYTEEYNVGGTVTDYNGDSLNLTADATWQRLVQPITTEALTTSTRIFIVTDGTSPNATAYIDGVMLHLGTEAIDYFDGATTDAGGFVYDWIGDAHNSASTKSTGGLSVASRLRRSNFELRPAY
jgi:hypothetical protein